MTHDEAVRDSEEKSMAAQAALVYAASKCDEAAAAIRETGFSSVSLIAHTYEVAAAGSRRSERRILRSLAQWRPGPS